MRAIFCRDPLLEDSYQVSTHYIARCFARHEWDVLWLSRPWHPYSFLNPRGFEDKASKFRIWMGGKPLEASSRLSSYVFSTLVPYKNLPLLRSRWVGRNSLHWAVPSVGRKLQALGFHHPDLLWISDIAQYSMLDLVAAHRTVLHVTDDYLSFSTTPQSFLAIESWAVKRVDAIVVPNPKLAELIRRRHDLEPARVLVVPHAVKFDPERLPAPPPELGAIPKPRVIYVGALETWLDWDLIEETVRRLSSVSFVFIGSSRLPDSRTASFLSRLRRQRNAFFLGELPHALAMACISEADAAIIPFQAPRPGGRGADGGRATEPIGSNSEMSLRLTEHVLPMKLFEYAALGVPIVSTRDFWSDLSLNIRTPLFVAPEPVVFCQSLRTALEDDGMDPASRREAGIAFARQHSWEGRFKSLLEQLHPPSSVPSSTPASGTRR